MKQGAIIGLKYRILDKLGQGGTSDVYLAENILLSNLWAIKVVRKNSAGQTSEMHEINVLKNLNHPMLPRVADLCEDENNLYLVMDYIKGETLSEALGQEGPFDELQAVGFAKQLCEVLFYLHQQKPYPIIYRDMKPSNIILDDNGRLHLVDFGTARSYNQEKTQDTVYIGTYGYAAPEQFGNGTSDERTDLYSLGITLFHLITGIHPAGVQHEKLMEHLQLKGISKGLSEIIRELVQPEPGKRIRNVRECLERLNGLNQKAAPFQTIFRAPKSKMKLTVALIGIEHGVGTTLAGIALSVLFARKNYQAAFLEMNDSGDMERLEKVLSKNGRLKKASSESFYAEGLTFYKAMDSVAHVSRKNFNALVVDLGSQFKDKVLQEFNRADIKLVVSPGTDWKIEKIKDFKSSFSFMDPHNEWIYIVPTVNHTDEKAIQRSLQIKNVLTFPIIRNLFNPGRQEQKCLESVFDKAMELSGLKSGI